MKFRRFAVLAATAATVGACSVSGGASPRVDSTRITRAELDELHELGVRNLYEAIDRARPRWLTVRSAVRSFGRETVIVVFQDDVYMGDQYALERMGTEGVYEIRQLDGATAQATLSGIGNYHVQHAIVVHMRAPPGGGE